MAEVLFVSPCKPIYGLIVGSQTFMRYCNSLSELVKISQLSIQGPTTPTRDCPCMALTASSLMHHIDQIDDRPNALDASHHVPCPWSLNSTCAIDDGHAAQP
jgi:hypothetical protein